MTNKILSSKNDFFIKNLLIWFQKCKRDFPWRRKKNPFDLLIAEFMLQKTNATSVLKVYESFLKKFPNMKSIYETKQAVLEEELKDLGLYKRRARDLKKIAEILRESEVIPQTKEDLFQLPGIGNYMANAILCFGFGKKIPIVDANVGRIISRFFNFEVKSAPSRDKKLFSFLEELIPDNAREFNYALLDFGALTCKAQKPKCEECPLNSKCSFFTQTLIEITPS